MMDSLSAGKDATQTFFGLHRHEVLLRPQYKRLQIGTVAGQEEQFRPLLPGELSKVPYAEPTWLSKGYYSPYYSDNHRKFQTAVREFFTTVVQPESQRCEENGKRISQEVVDKMRYVILSCHVFSFSTANQTHLLFSDTNIISMRLGPGKHLQGRSLMGGIVKPEEFDYFHEVKENVYCELTVILILI